MESHIFFDVAPRAWELLAVFTFTLIANYHMVWYQYHSL